MSVDGLRPATLGAGDIKDPSRVLFLIDSGYQAGVAVDEHAIALLEGGQGAERADDGGDPPLSGLGRDVIERSAAVGPPTLPDGWRVSWERVYGDTLVVLTGPDAGDRTA